MFPTVFLYDKTRAMFDAVQLVTAEAAVFFLSGKVACAPHQVEHVQKILIQASDVLRETAHALGQYKEG